MDSIDKQFSVCPVCGSKLIRFRQNSTDKQNYLCSDSRCRIVIKNNSIYEMDMTLYSKLQQQFGFSKQKSSNGIRAYMLLKEDLSAPLLVKNTKNPLLKDRNSFCIVSAESKDDALRMFNDKFEYIKISSDMVVEINIEEIEAW